MYSKSKTKMLPFFEVMFRLIGVDSLQMFNLRTANFKQITVGFAPLTFLFNPSFSAETLWE